MTKSPWHPSARLRLTAIATLIGLATVLAPLVALADDLFNDIDGSIDTAREVVQLTTEDGATNITVQPTQDAENGCNLKGNGTTLVVAVASSDESIVKLGAGSTPLTFESCSDVRTVTVRPQGVTGEANITFTEVSNTALAPINLATANFKVVVTAPDPPPAQDSTAPDISYVLNPASPNGNRNWYTSDVTLTWTVTENESNSSLVKTGCVDQNITADQQNQTYSCSATSDGGSAGPVNVDIKRDATKPNVALVGDIDEGDQFYFSFVPDEPTCDASDDTSGLLGDCVVSGYQTDVGTHTVKADAEDNAGNTRRDSRTYEVLAWTINGFFRPVDMPDVLNTIKGAQTVPLKFEVFAGDLELTDTAVVRNFSVNKVNCNNLDVTATDAIEVAFLTTGGTSLRYDATDGQFVQNWKTPKEAGCYVTTMKTQDGSSIEAFFKVK